MKRYPDTLKTLKWVALGFGAMVALVWVENRWEWLQPIVLGACVVAVLGWGFATLVHRLVRRFGGH